MNRYILIRRLRGPAILLLIGVLALLYQAGTIPYFWRLFWPLLLIMLGVLLLAERAALSAEGGYPLFPSVSKSSVANAGAGQGGPQSAGTAGTAIEPTQPHDYGDDTNGGQS